MRIRFLGGGVSGGQKQVYRQVDVLNELGYDAAVVVESEDDKPTWFKNQTRIVVAGTERLTEKDYLVIGEQAQEKKTDDCFKDASLVVFVQNPYGVIMGFEGLKGRLLNILAMYRDEVKAVLCVSEHSEEVLSWMLRTPKILRVKYSFDRDPLGYCDNKEKIISFMPRKSYYELNVALYMLMAKGMMEDWRVFEIKRVNEARVADILKRTSIFMSGSCMEGFGMPPAEAMACGCVVVGFDGVGGREFMSKGAYKVVDNGDNIGLAMAVKETMGLPDIERKRIGRKASDFVLSEYSTQAEVDSIKRAWGEIIG